MEVDSIYNIEKKKSGVERYRELNEQEKQFCNSVLNGRSQIQAVVDAGYITEEGLTDPDTKAKGKYIAENLIRKPAVIDYIKANKRTISIVEDRDDELLAFHIYEIAMGRCVREGRDTKGRPTKETPTFADQISAGSLYLKIREQEKKDKLLNNIKQANRVAEIQTNKVKSLLEQYKFDKPLTLTEDISADFIDIPLTKSASVQQEVITQALEEKERKRKEEEEIIAKVKENVEQRKEELRNILKDENASLDEKMDAEFTLLQHNIAENPLVETKKTRKRQKSRKFDMVAKEVEL